MGFFGATNENPDKSGNLNPAASAYERKKRDAAARSRSESAAGRDIGELPPPEDPKRREACRLDFKLYCETYHGAKFPLEWSESHLELIAAIERAVIQGEKRFIGFPRGTGKTTLCETAVEWATSYGHRRLAVIIASEEGKATDSLEAIKKDLETNDLLLADFPEIVIPIRKLNRAAQKARGQTYLGQPTFIEWGAQEIVFASIPGSPGSGACIAVAGLTGSHVRGVKRTLPNGEIQRPDLVLVDDPQTRTSAKSPSMSRTRELTVCGDVLGMAGPGKSLSLLGAVTVIYRGDLSDKLLDRTLHPEFRGIRQKLMPSLPTNLELWRKYWDIRSKELQRDGDGSEANAFYESNREAMDAGAEVMWPQRFEPDEISAVQNCMNLYFGKPETFASEYQNEPLSETSQEVESLDSAEVASRVNRVARHVVPKECDKLTAMIDVHKQLLYFTVSAWSDGFGGAAIDYGTFPQQPTFHFTLDSCPLPLKEQFPDLAPEVAIEKGLALLVDQLMSKQWEREESEEPARIGFMLIDEGYETDIVRRVIRRSPYRDRIRPSKGVGIAAHQNPMSEWPVRDGEKAGLNWRRAAVKGGRQEAVKFDSNAWKSFLRVRLSAPPEAPDAYTLFGDNPQAHVMLGDHFAAEYPTQTEGKGRVCEVWQDKPGRPDNHLWDTTVGTAVGASILGVQLPTIGRAERKVPSRRRRRGITYVGGRTR